MITYKLRVEGPERAPSNGVMRLPDGALIPADPANTDYQEYLKWLEAGNAPLGADTLLPNDSVTDPQEQ